MRASSVWLLVLPFLLMAGGVWNGWVRVEMEAVRFSRAQVDVIELQKALAAKPVDLVGTNLLSKEVLKTTEIWEAGHGIWDPWGAEYRAALLMDGSGKVVFYSAGPDGKSCLSEKSADDIFAGNSFDRWASSIPEVGWWRGISLLAAGFLFSQIIARRVGGAFPRSAVED